jgi:hypothetical protein
VSTESGDFSPHSLGGKEIPLHSTGQRAIDLHIKLRTRLGQFKGRRKTMGSKKKAATKKPKKAKALQPVKPLRATVTHI